MTASRAWTRAVATPVTASEAAVIGSTSAPTGAVAFFLRSAVPTGWIKLNGGSIGNASSGATRANADTQALFTRLWEDTTLTIQTSSGGASTRGASAAADWAANRRIVLPDVRSEFIRGWDDGRGVDAGRVLGSAQAEMVGPHNHTVAARTDRSTSAGSETVNMAGGQTTNTGNGTGTENRPRNVALMACVKL